MRYALAIEYDGRQFSGWETQKNRASVQTSVEQALSAVADHRVSTICAGRTDAGVHARGQVIHFDSPANRETHAWVLGTNANLPDTVNVLWAKPVADDFHARYSALRRHYRFIILNRPVRSSLLRDRTTWVLRHLNAERMHDAAQYLLGKHDFTTYRAVACQSKTAVRTIYSLDVARHGDFITLDIVANAFLYHMVRNIAGVLIDIGEEKHPPRWVHDLLKHRDRRAAGVTAEPFGLYLMQVTYPSRFGITVGAPTPLVW